MAWVSPVAAAGNGTVGVVIAPADDAVEVVYTLPAPATSLALRLADGPTPAAEVRVREEGLTFRDGRITGTAPFTRATLTVTADRGERDGVYPLARPVAGRGWVLYAPYLLPRGHSVRVSVRSRGRAAVPLSEPALNGYIVVGASPERHRGFRLLAGAGISPASRDTVLDRTAQLLAFYRARLGRAPDQEPTIILTRQDLLPGMSRSLLRGDVSANGVVFLRTYVGGPETGEPPSLAQYTGFLAHELFHLWNRSGDPARQNGWLAEGGAEYAGWVAAATLWPAEFRLEQRLGSALLTCMMYLGPQSISSLDEDQSRGVRYPCGAVIQWVADAGTRAQSAGLDVFAIWRDLLSRRRSSGSYTLDDFRNALSRHAPNAAPVVESLLNGTGNERWEALAASLNGFGAQLRVNPPTAFSLRLAAAKSLVLSACREIHGVGEDMRGLFVQAPQACAAFGDSAVIEQAGGASPTQDPAGFYRAVRESCGQGTSIAVTVNGQRGRRTENVRCDVDVIPPPPEIEVIRALPPPNERLGRSARAGLGRR